MQWLGGSVSSGEGEGEQETGVDLIPINEIRELGVDDQFIFMHGLPPIKCKKVRYYQHPYFKDKFDKNPIES
jgi:type IV secretion system protein VirD4